MALKGGFYGEFKDFELVINYGEGTNWLYRDGICMRATSLTPCIQ